MDRVANLRADERRDLFRESAARRGMRPAVVEKDFWVCWVLKKLFTDEHLKEQIVFKGGTTSRLLH
jgi:predicted nucleotidyltransferase component of viral defense system